MQLHITPGDGAPIYRQIIDQVKNLVAAGRLKPGDEMPTIRALAQQLLINPNTVARSYRELEAQGILLSRQGSGTVLADGGSPLARSERMRMLTTQVDKLLTEAQQLGFDQDTVLDLVKKRYKRRKGKNDT
ncbi:MAG: GntR family transcriptional regulator [Candidatus Hydrogenedentes bacterium]|nr:GntR family transcriptional regulator [Candidatus Hydrogenedentota bacterium]